MTRYGTHKAKREFSEVEEQAGLELIEAGMPPDQAIGFVNAGIDLTDRQAAWSAVARQADEEDGPQEILTGGARGSGKAGKLSTKVRGHRGWTTLGKLKVGSIIMNPSGVQQRVVQIHDRGKLQFYRLTFEDGASVEASGDHLWGFKLMSGKPRRKNKASNIAASEMPDTDRPDQDWNARYMANCNVTTTEDLINRLAKGQRLAVPLSRPIETQDPNQKPLSIEPYFLGVLLGDGCVCYRSNTIGVTTMDHEIDYVARWNLEQWGGRVTIQGEKSKAWTVRATAPKLKWALRELGIDDKRSWEKSIPGQYRESSLETRWRLIQGLMDTDGYVDDGGRCSYSTTSEQLAKDFQEIAWSLGFTAKITSKIPVCANAKPGPKKCRRVYTVWLRGWEQDRLATIQRKKERLRKPQHYPMRRIVSIETTTIEDARCITVSHPNALYVTDDYIVTHNSFWVLSQLGADDCQRFPGLTCLFLRQIGKRAAESMRELRQGALMGIPNRHSESKGEIRFPNGSKIVTGAFARPSDIGNYLGLSYDVIAVEELTQIPGEMYEALLGSLRTAKRHPETGELWRPRAYNTTNPGGVAHRSVKERFVRQKTPDPRRVFLPALVTDNPHVDKDYIDRLQSLSGWRRKAWLEGDWDTVAGAYFTNFSYPHHVSRFELQQPHRVTFDWWLSYDYGFTHRCCWTLIGEDSQGHRFIVDQTGEQKWGVPRMVEALREMLRLHRIKFTQIQKILAGHDCFAASLSESGSRATIEKAMRKHSIDGKPIVLQKANIARVQGAQEIVEWLGEPAEGRPSRLTIHSRCVRLVDQLQSLQHSATNPEDVCKKTAEKGDGDDEYDSFRYGIMKGSGTGTSQGSLQ